MLSWGVKKPAYVILFVDRATRCITTWRVVEQATETVVQAILDDPVQAAHY